MLLTCGKQKKSLTVILTLMKDLLLKGDGKKGQPLEGLYWVILTIHGQVPLKTWQGRPTPVFKRRRVLHAHFQMV